MIKLFLALCSLLFLAQLGIAQNAAECYGSEFRLRNSMESSQDGENGQILEYINGVLDICLNGTYVSVCNDTDIDPLEVARIACQYMGYYGLCTSSMFIPVIQFETLIFRNFRVLCCIWR